MTQEERLWDYYRDIALHLGAKQEYEGKHEELRKSPIGKTQTPFSAAEFYMKDGAASRVVHSPDLAETHPLLAAFLGNEAACSEVQRQISTASCPYTDEQLAPFFSRDAPLGSDKEQARVVRRVLSQPFTIVQGPPGTGKTKTIANIVSCIEGLETGADGGASTVAIVSTNKEAVFTAAADILDLRRAGTSDVEPSLKGLYAPLGNMYRRLAFYRSLGVDERRKLGFSDDYKGGRLPKAVLERYPVFGCTLHSLYRCFAKSVDAFDYVIVDESSQVPNYLGLIAVFFARHLVVMGDRKQIPPIVQGKKVKGVTVPDDAHRDGKDNSFILTCQEVFGQPVGSDGNIMLRRHYRCEPGIIEFCNQNVYVEEDGTPQLIPMRRSAGGAFVPAGEPQTVPMRVVWYEGAYAERLGDLEENKKLDPDVRPQKHNMRQVMIFANEEWPRVRRLVDEGKSVCVLSPYRAPVLKLKQLLKERGEGTPNPEDPNALIIETTGDEQSTHNLFQLTIHKAQGKGYDVVYYLSVDDYDYKVAPWSQKEYLVNVAVSRAREEFCAIVSSVWLPEGLAHQLGAWRPSSGWDHEHVKGQDAYNLKKLMRYVSENLAKAEGDYGFHKAQTQSVFDEVPFLRAEQARAGADMSAPQKALTKALGEELAVRGYEVRCEVPVADVLGQLSHKKPVAPTGEEAATYQELQGFVASDSRFDLVVYKDGKPQMAVEVDGQYHREGPASISNDVRKNHVVSDLLKGATYGVRDVDTKDYLGYLGPMQWEGLTPEAPFALVRIPFNGETTDEVDLVLHLLDEFEGRAQ